MKKIYTEAMTKVEQMKREFAYKWGGSVAAEGYGNARFDVSKQCLSDLNALLEKATADMYPKEFTEWIGSQELYCDKGEWLCPVEDSVYGEIIRKTTAELFDYWLMNVKK